MNLSIHHMLRLLLSRRQMLLNLLSGNWSLLKYVTAISSKVDQELKGCKRDYLGSIDSFCLIRSLLQGACEEIGCHGKLVRIGRKAGVTSTHRSCCKKDGRRAHLVTLERKLDTSHQVLLLGSALLTIIIVYRCPPIYVLRKMYRVLYSPSIYPY